MATHASIMSAKATSAFLLLALAVLATDANGPAGGSVAEDLAKELQVMVPVMMMKVSKVLRAARYDISILYRRVESLRFQVEELQKRLGVSKGGGGLRSRAARPPPSNDQEPPPELRGEPPNGQEPPRPHHGLQEMQHGVPPPEIQRQQSHGLPPTKASGPPQRGPPRAKGPPPPNPSSPPRPPNGPEGPAFPPSSAVRASVVNDSGEDDADSTFRTGNSPHMSNVAVEMVGEEEDRMRQAEAVMP